MVRGKTGTEWKYPNIKHSSAENTDQKKLPIMNRLSILAYLIFLCMSISRYLYLSCSILLSIWECYLIFFTAFHFFMIRIPHLQKSNPILMQSIKRWILVTNESICLSDFPNNVSSYGNQKSLSHYRLFPHPQQQYWWGLLMNKQRRW